MRYLLTILLTLTIWSGAVAQDGTHLIGYDHDDIRAGEDRQKIKRRHLRTEIDSTRFRMSAWNGECVFEVDFLSDTTAITDYRIGQRNGHKFLRIGNDDYKARLYMTPYGAFEFDAIVRHMVDGQYKVTVPISTKGLTFWYQDTLLDVDKFDSFRPDSVVGSYAIYHSTRKHNTNYADGRFDEYATGKFGHLFCPTVWDANGDSAKGFVLIDTVAGTMTIGATPEWSATAVAPVTIDPIIGRSIVGATSSGNTANQAWALGPYTGAAGTATSMSIYTTTDGNGEDLIMGIYDGLTSDDGLVRGTAGFTFSGTNTFDTELLTSDVTISAITYYIYINWDLASTHKYDATGGPDRRFDNRTYDGTLPTNLTGVTDISTDRDYSAYFTYMAAGGGGGWPGGVIPVTIH